MDLSVLMQQQAESSDPWLKSLKVRRCEAVAPRLPYLHVIGSCIFV